MSKLKVPSIRLRLDFAKYRTTSPVSKSELDLFIDCPARFKAWRDGRLSRESSPAQSFGTMLHSLVLQRYEAFHEKPDGMTFASKEGKEWRDAHAGKPIVNAEEAASLRAAAKAIRHHHHAANILMGKKEVSMFGRHAETGTELKGRADVMGAGFITDLKKCRRADNRSIAQAIAQYGYHRQAWMYLELAKQNGLQCRDFYFVFIQPGELPMVNVKKLSEAAIELGGIEIGGALRRLKACEETGIWPDYSGGEAVGTIDLPTWCYNDTSGMAMMPKDEMNASELDSESVDLIP